VADGCDGAANLNAVRTDAPRRWCTAPGSPCEGTGGVVHLSARPSVTGMAESRLIIHAVAGSASRSRSCLILGFARLLGGPHLEIGVEGHLQRAQEGSVGLGGIGVVFDSPVAREPRLGAQVRFHRPRQRRESGETSPVTHRQLGSVSSSHPAWALVEKQRRLTVSRVSSL